ncbi:MAG: hypothetical protein GQ477_04895 [Nanohaloarchaea archaeon]|nr:hypothetical protein [Candidatus Nanohaloarchaea archaeon]
MPTNMGGDKPDIPQSDNSNAPETSPSTENIEGNQDPADEEEPEDTPGLNPLVPIAAAYLSTLRKKKKK